MGNISAYRAGNCWSYGVEPGLYALFALERAKKSRGVDRVVGVFISMDMEGVGWANAERVALELELLGMGVVDMRSPPLLLLLLLFMVLVLGNAESVGFEGILGNALCPKTEVAPDGVVLNADVVVPPPPPPPPPRPNALWGCPGFNAPNAEGTPNTDPVPVPCAGVPNTLVVPAAAGAFVVVGCPNAV